MSYDTLTTEVASRLGLKQSVLGRNFYGIVDSYQIQIFSHLEHKTPAITVIVGFLPDNNDSAIKERVIQEAKNVQNFKVKQLKIVDGLLSYNFLKGFRDKNSAESLAHDIRVFVKGLLASGARSKMQCRVCSKEIEETTLVNGVLSARCSSCLDTDKQKIDFQKKEYERRNVSYFNVYVIGILAAMLGAAIWGGITVATETMYGAIAVVNGYIVGISMMYIAKKQDSVVLVGIGILTLLSVIAGNLFFFGYHYSNALAAEGEAMDYIEFLSVSPVILLQDIGGTAFASIMGFLGAWSAVGQARAMYTVPQHIVEK
ncbi:MAG: hypothetical protein KDD60_05425 [Bdellovibrionales bacterium]|nr:hypothetical protein [Bdellovibrionales bacterium]